MLETLLTDDIKHEDSTIGEKFLNIILDDFSWHCQFHADVFINDLWVCGIM